MFIKSKFGKYKWVFPLLLVTIIAILLRSLPSILNAAWGVDFGIYYGLTNSFVETKSFINPYNGWGSSYQYFPILYIITGMAHFITGIDTIQLLPKIAPVFGGLTILILYFIVYELFKNRTIALISAGLLSTATFHVYQTSHAAPLTIGHFFMMISLFLFIKFIKKSTYLIPLLISTVLLILSHHFTTYFYIICITGILFSYVHMHSPSWKKSWFSLSYVLFASTVAFSYWMFIATPVYESFMNGKLFLSPPLVILFFFGLTITGFFLSMYSNQIKNHIVKTEKKLPTISLSKKVIIVFFALLAVSLIAIKTGIPGVYSQLTPLAVFYSLPMVLLVSFSLAGFSLLKEQKKGFFIQAWSIALMGSFLFSILSANLMPDRHLEYLIVPLCVPAAMSMNHLIQNHKVKEIKSLFSSQKIIRRNHLLKPHLRPFVIPSIVAILIIANTMTAYSSIDALDSLDERVSDPCLSVMEWMEGNMSSDSVIASDHRLSMLCWANGYNITYGETNTTWTSENVSQCLEELQQFNITHILIDDIMVLRVVNVNVGMYYHMTNSSYEKFQEEPFTLIYRNATTNNQFEEIHWIELYEIDYSKISNKTEVATIN
jgi:hypothetical protein